MFRMLDEVSRMEGAKPELLGYIDTILREAGVAREDFDSEDATVRRQARTQAHEFFARGFETYLAEGKAPSKGLRSVFRKLRAWMIEVYRDVVQALGIELSPEMRDIYARLLATPEEITAETTVQELAIEEAAIKEELNRYEAEARERATQERMGIKALDGTLKAEAVLPTERTIEPVSLTPESGRSIDEAEDSELLLLPDGSTALGMIDEAVAEAAGIPAGEIRANVGAVRHAEKTHGAQILDAGYPDAQTFILKNLTEFNEIRRGTGESLLLIHRGEGQGSPTVAVELIDEDGAYRVKTAWIAREGYVKKKELLATRSATPVNSPASALASGSGDQRVQGDLQRWSARQTSNSVKATVPPGTASVNPVLSLSEALRRGYAMAEKYAKAAYRAGRDEATLKARERQKLLRAKLQERQKAKKEVKKLVQDINNMARSETISWAMHTQIEKLLSSYDLKKRNKETMERRAELEEYLKAHPEAVDTMNAADLKHLGKTTLGNMKLEELRSLHEQVAQLYDRGKEEYKVWDLERAERRDTMQAELRKALEKKKVDLPQVAKRPEDLKKQYKGVTGKLAKAKDWVYAATLNPDRLCDWFDGGRTGYKGPFVRYFVDLVNKQRDEALRHIYERRTWMEKGLRELGFRMSDFARMATELNGIRYTWSEIMEIYIGMRNDKKARAILYGNFKNSANPEGDVAHLISLLTEDHKRAAELVVQDHNRNVDRIEAGLIQAFQKGMDRETDYSSIHRMEHLSSMGLIDAESSEALVDGMADAGVLRRVEDGFMKKRVEMKDEDQTSIQLGLFENWHTDVSRHEHAAAMAGTARDLASALLSRNPADKQTLGKMVKERFGDEAWRSLVSFFNDSVLDDARLAHNLLDRLTKTVTKNMVIAYLAGNLGTVLKQTTSLPRFLNTAGAHRMLVSIAQFLTQGPKFLEKVYELDPQMRERKGSAILTMLREDPQWGKRMYQRGLDWMLAPIAMADRWVAAIGWKATYDANLKRLGHEGAVREAQRAVRLIQQPASAKDSARMWRQNGFVRLAMVFTSDAAQTFGMTAYDLVQQLRGGKIGKAFMTLTALAMTAILMKAASDGLPSDEDDEDEDRNWVLDAFTEQAIASIPLIGKEAMVLYDNLSGKYRGSQYSAIVAPIEKIARAYRLWTDEDSDEEDFRRATWLALEALSLSGAAPVPVTGVKRVVQSLEMAEEDGTAAALNMVGIRRRPQ